MILRRSFPIFAWIVYICNLSLVSSNNNDAGLPSGRRELDNEAEYLKCNVIVVDSEYEEGTSADDPDVHDFLCNPIVNGEASSLFYHLELPSAFLEEYKEKLLLGDRQILIENGTINNNRVNIPDNATVFLKRASRLVPDPPGYVTKNVLVLRVSTINSNQTYSKQQLSRNFFADDDLTLRSQYAACSHGKLIFEPVSSNVSDRIENGVLDLHLDIQAQSLSRLDLANMVIERAQEIIGNNLTDVANNVIICQPPDSRGSWLAYAYVHQPYTVYKGEWCGFISANMHEVGHNLGFKHSNSRSLEDGDGTYGDKTCYMGWSYKAPGWPALCFNAQKNWQTGWFADRSVEIDVTQGVWSGKLATFVDYDKTAEEEHVVIKVGETLFLQYNRAKGMNAQTYDHPDELVIVENGAEGSKLIGGVDGEEFNTTFFQYNNFEDTNRTLFIAACSRHLGNNRTDADYYHISVGLDAIDCNVTALDSQSSSPSPSTAPSEGRSEVIADVLDRGQLCDDDMTQEFEVPGLPNITCSFLQNRPSVRNYLCDATRADEVCKESCGTCSDSCDDDNNAYFEYDGEYQNCEWARTEIRTQADFDSICSPGKSPHRYCREACNSCPSPIDGDACDDSQDATFVVFILGEQQCSWLENLPDSQKKWWMSHLCYPGQEVYDLCPKTCGKCFDFSIPEPVPEPEPILCQDSADTFTYLAEVHDCEW
eukprot:CAMPEP_0194199332 /NCGR_PEP_ID=MMETSP0156-20130528/391_1 /TAXON_ID=33649 /ORGANISM="Thalassionema nitzschioides, Strain L26-B" /LENGTH=708 /DNA_ID=CAMNT_0038924217 /DNA_START=123 /DNA_END=2246 /DNA_ORIENTATION=-